MRVGLLENSHLLVTAHGTVRIIYVGGNAELFVNDATVLGDQVRDTLNPVELQSSTRKRRNCLSIVMSEGVLSVLVLP